MIYLGNVLVIYGVAVLVGSGFCVTACIRMLSNVATDLPQGSQSISPSVILMLLIRTIPTSTLTEWQSMNMVMYEFIVKWPGGPIPPTE